MQTHRLSFCTITKIADDICEIVVDEGIEMDEGMVEEYHAFLLANLKAPFSLLINKENAYTYTFAAQKKLAMLDEINTMAVVVYSNISKLSTDTLAYSVPRETPWNIRIFEARDDALAWLEKNQQRVRY